MTTQLLGPLQDSVPFFIILEDRFTFCHALLKNIEYIKKISNSQKLQAVWCVYAIHQHKHQIKPFVGGVLLMKPLKRGHFHKTCTC